MATPITPQARCGMRFRPAIPRSVLVLGCVLLSISSCRSDESVTGVSAPLNLACPVTITQLGTNPAVPRFSGPFYRSWHLKNSSGSNVSITGRSCVKTGNISSCTGNNFGSYVPANGMIDGDVTFYTGAAGSGSVALRVSLGAPCNTTLTGKPWIISIQ